MKRERVLKLIDDIMAIKIKEIEMLKEKIERARKKLLREEAGKKKTKVSNID